MQVRPVAPQNNNKKYNPAFKAFNMECINAKSLESKIFEVNHLIEIKNTRAFSLSDKEIEWLNKPKELIKKKLESYGKLKELFDKDNNVKISVDYSYLNPSRIKFNIDAYGGVAGTDDKLLSDGEDIVKEITETIEEFKKS